MSDHALEEPAGRAKDLLFPGDCNMLAAADERESPFAEKRQTKEGVSILRRQLRRERAVLHSLSGRETPPFWRLTVLGLGISAVMAIAAWVATFGGVLLLDE